MRKKRKQYLLIPFSMDWLHVEMEDGTVETIASFDLVKNELMNLISQVTGREIIIEADCDYFEAFDKDEEEMRIDAIDALRRYAQSNKEVALQMTSYMSAQQIADKFDIICYDDVVEYLGYNNYTSIESMVDAYKEMHDYSYNSQKKCWSATSSRGCFEY